MSLDLKLCPPEISSDNEKSPENPETATTAKRSSFLGSLRDKFKKPKDPPGGESKPTSYSDETVFLILKDFLQPETTKSLAETAQAILALLPEGKPASTEVWSAGTVIVEVAAQIPYSHPSQQKLAALVEELSMADTFISKPGLTGKRHRCMSLGETMRDWYNGPNDEDANEWPNLSAFYANIDARRIFPGTPLFALWAMRDAFEREQGDTSTSDGYEDFPGRRDQEVLAAAQYILWNGQGLFKGITYLGDEDGKKLTIERWRGWKGGFRAVVDDEGVGGEARGVAGRAADLMDVFERALLFD